MTHPHHKDFMDDLLQIFDKYEIDSDFFLVLNKGEDGRNYIQISERSITISDFKVERFGVPERFSLNPRESKVSFDFK